MQTHGGQAAADAITARERYFRERILVDWANDGQFAHPLSDITEYVDAVQVDSSLASTLPSELMLIEGASAADLKLTLTGYYDGLPLAAHFAPYNGLGVFYSTGITEGAAVTYDIGVDTATGTVWYRQFTGVVRNAKANRGSNEVTISCLDNVEKMRNSIDLKADGIPVWCIQAGYREGGLGDPCAIIDLAGRSAGFSSSPLAGNKFEYDWTATILSVPFHGTRTPEIGNSDNFRAIKQTEDWVDDSDESKMWTYDTPFGLPALNRQFPGFKKAYPGFGARDDIPYWVDQRTKAGSLSNWGGYLLCAWVYWPGTSNSGKDCPLIDLHCFGVNYQLWILADGSVTPGHATHTEGIVGHGTPTYGDGKPIDTGWNYVEVSFFNSYSGTPSGWEGLWTRTRVNDQLADWTRLSDPVNYNPGDRLAGLVMVTPYYSMCNAEVIYSNINDGYQRVAKEWQNIPSNAQISAGLNRIAYTFNQQGQEAWSVAKDVAKAEFGVVRFDEHGNLVFWNQDDVRAKQNTIVRSYTLDEVEGLSMEATTDSIRNQWAVTTTDGSFSWQTCYDYSSDGPMLVSANGIDDRFGDPPFYESDMIVKSNTPFWGYILAQENLISPEPWQQRQQTTEDATWEGDVPLMGFRVYAESTPDGSGVGAIQTGSYTTQQFWVGAGMWQFFTNGSLTDGFDVWFEDSEGRKYLRIRGTMVDQEKPHTWQVTDQDSIAKYGTRSISIGNSFWYQDYDAIHALIEKQIERFAEPVPVTDDITVPGDPRVQLGDTIAVHDPNGMGETITLQILGINRARRPGQGLQDTYSVEVIRPPRVGVWDDRQYGIYDQSFIWGE